MVWSIFKCSKEKRMRNMAEQKKLVTPLIWFVFMAILFVVIVGVLFLNVINPDATIAGYRLYDFNEEVEKVDMYDIDDGEYVHYIEKGSKVLVKEVAVEDLQKNDVFAFYTQDDNGKVVVITQIYVDYYFDLDGETRIYSTHDLDNTDLKSFKIESGRLMGTVVAAIPVLGMVTAYFSSSTALMYGVIVVLALFMLGIPLVVFVLRLKARRIGSPFPEGVNVNKLKTENLYIYENIRSFIASSGMTIENGYDCDLIYMGDILFGVLHCTNGNMYVNINKDFQRYDNKIDRSGYICIPHAGNLESAKKRINSIYRAYFMDMKYNQSKATRGARQGAKQAPKKGAKKRK